MADYIHELPTWPRFHWSAEGFAKDLSEVRHRQGLLAGRMRALGFPLQEQAVLSSLTEEVIKSSEIEGEILDRDQVRSSLARHLGLEVAGLPPADRRVEGVVEMMLDATQKYGEPLTKERLFGWHAALFPTGRSGMRKITVGAWRTDEAGPMQVVSGPIGHEKVHYEAPAAPLLDDEMKAFLDWYNAEADIDPVVKAALAHLWFVTIHPFDDGNGRIARAIADMALARSERSSQRYYSMSAQIRVVRNAYYAMLEQTQKGDLDITPWLQWFLDCLNKAIAGAEIVLAAVLRKAEFWKKHAATPFNARQRNMVNALLDGFDGKLTSSKWAKLESTSPDTALRDINDLVVRGILKRDAGGGRSTSYSLAPV
jgi:Fic family protein